MIGSLFRMALLGLAAGFCTYILPVWLLFPLGFAAGLVWDEIERRLSS